LFIRWRPRPKARCFAVLPQHRQTQRVLNGCGAFRRREWLRETFASLAVTLRLLQERRWCLCLCGTVDAQFGRVVFKKIGDGMEKQTRVGGENREDV